MRAVIIILVAAMASGCASIVSKSTYPVTFDSNPSGASIRVWNKDGLVVYNGTTPATLALDSGAGFFSPAQYEVEADMPGFRTGKTIVRAGLDGWYIGNLIFGGPIGLLFVDPITGAMWRLDSRVFVNLGRPQDDGGKLAEAWQSQR